MYVNLIFTLYVHDKAYKRIFEIRLTPTFCLQHVIYKYHIDVKVDTYREIRLILTFSLQHVIYKYHKYVMGLYVLQLHKGTYGTGTVLQNLQSICK